MGKKLKTGKSRQDRFYHLAKASGYRARSAFKIIQLNRKYQFLSQCRVLVDLCAAPGGWLQAAVQHMPMSSVIVGVDLVPIKPIKNVVTLQEDITTDKCRQSLQRELKTWKVDCFLNDGAPNVGSAWVQDAYSQSALALSALKLATHFLSKGGWFITKVFRSKDYQALMWVFQQLFEKVHSTKPQASRIESAEIFVVCKGYLAPDRIDPKLLDPKHVFGELDLDGDHSTTFRQLERPKKKAAEGYSADRGLLYLDCSVADFLLQDHHLDKMAAARALVFDKESQVFARHPATTDEVRACCQDIQVLGKRELRLLLAWRKTLRQFMKKAGEGSDDEGRRGNQQEEEAPKPSDSNPVEEQIAALKNQEESILKKKRKQLRKKVFKTKEKLALRLQSSEDNPGMDRPQDMFKLDHIRTAQHLASVQEGGDSDSDSESDQYSEEEAEDSERSILSEDEEWLRKAGENEESTAKDPSQPHPDGSDDDGDDDVDDDDDINDDDDVNGDDDDDGGLARLGREEEPGPLVVQFPEEREAASNVRQTSLWFGKEAFSGVEQDRDEDFELDAALSTATVQPPKTKGEPKHKKGTVATPASSKSLERPASTAGRVVPVSGEEDVESNGDSSNDSEDSDYEDMKQANEQEQESEKKSMEVVPAERKRAAGTLGPEGLALGNVLKRSKQAREDLIDGSYSRWSHNDEDLPDWFVEDEKMHCGKRLPVSKALLREYKQKMKEINARPIKKIAAAKAKKKAKLMKKLEAARKKAEHISDAPDVTNAEKNQQLRVLYRKANSAMRDNKKDKQYVVAKKGGKKLQQPTRMNGPYKIVDARRKKDMRAKKSAQKRKNSGRRKR